MTAIVTKNFRHRAATEFTADIDSANNYYLAIGRPDAWDSENVPDTPYDNTYSFHTDFWDRALAFKLISSSDWTYSAFRNQWIAGATNIVEYDDRDPLLGSKKYFVITESNNVYICLKAGTGSTVINPDVAIGTTTVDPDPDTDLAGDGYLWKYMFTLDPGAATKFLTTAFLPVRTLPVSPGGGASTALQTQWNVQSNATDGAIFNIKVTNGGSGYSTAPTVTVTDGSGGTGCLATATVSGGVVIGVQVNTKGSGYKHATISFSGGGGSGATGRAVIGPRGGFGADPVKDLGAHFVGLNITMTYDEGEGDLPVAQDFRQLAIIRNPYDYGTTNPSTATTMSANTLLTVASGYSFSADMVIEGNNSGAKGIVVTYEEDTNGYVRIIQNEDTGYTAFTTSDSVGESGIPGNEKQVIVVTVPEVEPHSGETIFLENRTAINRAGDQIETVKIVLEF
jgi:hypothetical protein